MQEDGSRPALGSVLEGRYRLVSEVGEGGIGWVFRAEHLKLGHEVAIKMLQPQYAAHAQMRPRFEREAKALAALSHPHIVTLTDYSVADGRPYLVMELLDGCTLSELIAKGPIDEAVVRHVALQILDGLIHAHEAGFVHRDLKPANIFLCALPTDPHHVKILDFGFVKLIEDETPGGQPVLTQSGVAFGTPSYMSPEQATGAATDERTDLYAFGVILFEMLAGRRPFIGSLPDIVRQHLTEPVPRLTVGGRPVDASPALREVLDKAMAKEAEDRFTSARELREALAAIPLPWTVHRSFGEDATMMAVPAPASAPSEPTKAARPGAGRSGAGSAPSDVGPEPERPADPRAAAPSLPERRERSRGPFRGLVFGLTVVAAVTGGAVWWFGIQPAAVAELGVDAFRRAMPSSAEPAEQPGAEAVEEPAGAPAEMQDEVVAAIDGEPNASLLDELSGDWWTRDDEDALAADEAPTDPGEESEAEGSAPAEGAEDETVASAEGSLADEALDDGVAEEALADGAPDEELDDSVEEVAEDVPEAALDDGASDEVAREALAAEGAGEQADEELLDEGDDESGEDEAADDVVDEGELLGPNPWRVRSAVPQLVSARRSVLAGHPLTRAEKLGLRELVRADRGDPRPHLAMAQSFMAEGNQSAALERYDLAQRVDDTARGDPRMLYDLLRLASEGSVRGPALAALARIYGDDAIPFIDELVDEGELPEERVAALRQVRARLEHGVPSQTRTHHARTRARRVRLRHSRARRRRAHVSRRRPRVHRAHARRSHRRSHRRRTHRRRASHRRRRRH